MRTLFILFGLWTIVAPIAVSQEKQLTFPNLKAKDLNGKEVSLPKDLPGDPCLVLVAFVTEHQEDLNLWMSELKLKESDDIKWIELPVIGPKNPVLKLVIDRGMRSGITDEKDRARTVTIYSSREEFNDSLGIKSVDQVYVVVVNKDGSVKKVIPGTPTVEKKQMVLEALAK